jgi:hypothetical protein
VLAVDSRGFEPGRQRPSDAFGVDAPTDDEEIADAELGAHLQEA